MTPELIGQILGVFLISIIFVVIIEVIRKAIRSLVDFLIELVCKPFKWFKNKVLKIKDKEEYINIKIIDKEKEGK